MSDPLFCRNMKYKTDTSRTTEAADTPKEVDFGGHTRRPRHGIHETSLIYT